MSDLPSLPLWVDAYIADTDHLSDAEHGRYLNLLMLMWRSPGCRIPNDDDWIARRFRRTVEAVKSELRPIIAEFCQSDGNWITQKRLQREFAYAATRRQNATESAKRRWKKEKAACDGNANTHNGRNASIPIPIPIPKIQESPPISPPPQDAPASPSPRTRGTRLSPDWKLPDEWRRIGAEVREKAGLPAIDLDLEADRFRDYWTARPGQQGVKLDWLATWRNWCRNARGSYANGHDPAAKAAADAAAAARIREIVARTQAEDAARAARRKERVQ